MKTLLLVLSFSVVIAHSCLCLAGDEADEFSDSAATPFPLQFSLKATTDFPLWLGLDGEILLYKHFSLDLGYGYIPPGYASILGNVVGSLAGNAGYQTLITSLTQQNSAFKIAAEYRFSGRSGWLIGAGLYLFSTSGDASIVDVLEALTGQSYTGLKNLLAALGKNPVVHTQSTIDFGEIHGGYCWTLHQHLHLRTTLGVADVLSSSIALSSNAPAFDNSLVGKNTYAISESNLQSILSSYGIVPVIEASLVYSFD